VRHFKKKNSKSFSPEGLQEYFSGPCCGSRRRWLLTNLIAIVMEVKANTEVLLLGGKLLKISLKRG